MKSPLVRGLVGGPTSQTPHLKKRPGLIIIYLMKAALLVVAVAAVVAVAPQRGKPSVGVRPLGAAGRATSRSSATTGASRTSTGRPTPTPCSG